LAEEKFEGLAGQFIFPVDGDTERPLGKCSINITFVVD
jgi:hypothetical protein